MPIWFKNEEHLRTLFAGAQLVAIIVAIFGGFVKLQFDLDAQKQLVAKLETAIMSLRDTQRNAAERLTRVETKVDLMLPTLQRIEQTIASKP